MSQDEKVVLETARFRVERAEMIGSDGALIERHVIRHPGSVVIIPVLVDGRVCLIKNFRISVNNTLVELPAGTLEPGEAPLQCAARELAEETGFRAERIEPLMHFFAAPGILDEKMHLFLATELSAGPAHREAGERIENLPITMDNAMMMIRDNRICDAKTIVGLMYYQHLRVQ